MSNENNNILHFPEGEEQQGYQQPQYGDPGIQPVGPNGQYQQPYGQYTQPASLNGQYQQPYGQYTQSAGSYGQYQQPNGQYTPYQQPADMYRYQQPVYPYGSTRPSHALINPEAQKLRKIAMIIGAIAAVLALFAVFLPFFSVGAFGVSMSISYIDEQLRTDGIIILILVVLALVLVFVRRTGRGIGSVLIGGVILGLTLFDMFYNMDKIGGGGYSHLVSKGIGFYIMLLASAGLIASGIIMMVARKKTR